MAISDDFSVAANGDIRYVGTGATYTVIAFHRWLGDLMDDAQAAGNDLLDITDATASERATDNLITLNSPYNIDDYAARFLYDGSIVQSGGNTIYDGIVCFAPANTYLQVIQNGGILSPNFWTTSYNADSVQGISHRFMVKVRSGGVDIDGRRLVGQTREIGKTFSEFRINGTSRGNNVFALQFSSDLNNTTIESTTKGWTTISNIEGYRLLDVDNNTVNEAYYSEWNRATYSINQLYERTKYLSRRGTVESSCADVGTNFNLGNGTIVAQGQSFANGTNAQFLVRAFFDLKIGAGAPSPAGNIVAKVYAHSGTFGTSSVPTGAAVATSDNVSVSSITSSYQTVEFKFSTPVELVASTNYVVSVEYTGDASNYLHVRGLAASGTHAGNRSQSTGTWAATAADDLNFSIHTSHKLYTVPGEVFRGITHELTMTTPRAGSFSAVERISWSGGTGILLAVDSVATSTKMWIQLLTGVAPAGGTTITGVTSSATATTSGTATERSLSYPFLGASTGSALIGAYGIGVETADLSASDKLFDLTNTQKVPPNNVTFTLGGLVASEDRVLVGPESGGTLQLNQFTLNGALTGAAVTAIVVNTAIPTDTPASGTIRVLLNTGIYRRVPYNSYSGSTFNISSTDFSGANQANNANNVFISYIDKLAASTSESFTVVYLSDRALFVRVRDGAGTPIKTFETTATLGSAGGSATAIRTSDA
jgi:hypothetical protein